MIDPVCGMEVVPGKEAASTQCGEETIYFCSRACQEKYVCSPAKKLTDYLYDVIIIGGGPAGISAGMYASLGGLDTLFLSKAIGGQAWDSTAIRNYPGFNFITGPELIERFKEQLFGNLKLAHKVVTVTGIRKSGSDFEVVSSSAETFRAKTVLLTTGMKRRRMQVPGEVEFAGKGIGSFHALAASRYEGREVVVVGGGNSAAQAALGLHEAGAKVTLVTRSYTPDHYLQEKIETASIKVVVNHRPARLEGTERVESFVAYDVDSREETSFSTGMVFVEIGLVPNSELVTELATTNRRGEVKIDANCRTGLPGLFAAGDVTATFGKRILIASGEGAKAILAVEQYLENLTGKA